MSNQNPPVRKGPDFLEMEGRYRAIVESQTELICRFLPDGTLTFANQAYCRQLDADREILGGQSIFTLVSEERRDYLLRALQAFSPENPLLTMEHPVLRSDGSTDWQHWIDQGIFDKEGVLVEVQSVGHNITERKLAEIAAGQRARELSALHTATATLLSTLDLEPLLGQILDAATSAIPAARKGMIHLIARDTGQLVMRAMLGYAETDPRIQKLTLASTRGYIARAVSERKPLLIHDITRDLTLTIDSLTALPDDSRSAIIAPLILNEQVLGALSLESSFLDAFTDSDLKLLVSFAVTATAAIRNAQLHSEVQKLAITDPLTGVYNRRGFYELGSREVERARRFGRPLSAIMFDIDNFKSINDTYGHLAGDQVLRVIANECSNNIRKVDIAGRYGGDEFVILLPENNLFSAVNVAERLRQRVLTSPAKIGDLEIHLSVSIGVAKMTADITLLDSLLRRADGALYLAKQGGRNRVAIG